MEFSTYVVALLLAMPDAPPMSPEQEAQLQDAHMAHLAHLHDSGELLVAGPVLGPPDRQVRGLSVFGCSEQRARELGDGDPAIQAGLYRHEYHIWAVPHGVISFGYGHLPRSMDEVRAP
ncbi:MAG TPA: YciI family protein [Segeticoccus sp.]|uniref:YciI family protein n=1 Tax=Segeticoccus sp. TaxID=2706531 RepID=UPI002D80B329|nr:YciI family protein [Segeticoccus sp.]HET8600473.1 YciI family protein [Segeticoccus sp.]